MARSHVKRQDQDPGTCQPTDHNFWTVNDLSRNPCEVVEQVLRVCPSAQESLGPLGNDMQCPGDRSSSCCCNVATYALLSACWVCQGGHKFKDISQIKTTYREFLSECPPKVDIYSFSSDIQPRLDILHIPVWASIHPIMDGNWDYHQARDIASASTSQPDALPSTDTQPSLSIMPSAQLSPTSAPISGSSKSSTPPGTIAASVLGAFAVAGLIGVGGWLCWRWRRRRMGRPSPGAKVDLMEPEMHENHCAFDSRAAPAPDTPNSLPRTSAFPFPYECVVPRHHPNAPHSYEPSHTDELTEPAAPPRVSSSDMRRHTAPTPLSPVDQLDRDLADLTGNPQGQVHQPYIHKTPMRRRASITTFTGGSSNSGSASSKRARRKSGADGEAAKQGRYYHLPPSAQYLADVARYPENVDPERPWNVRRR